MTWDASSSPLFSGNDMESRMILSMASPPLDTISLSPLPMEEQQHNYHPLNHLDRRLRLEQDILPLEKFARGASYPDTKELHDTYHRPLARVFEKDTASIGIFHDSVYSDEFSYPPPSSHGGPALDISSISETDRSPSPKAGPFRYSGSYSMDAGSNFVSHCWVSGNWFGMPCDVQNVDEVMYPEPATPVQQKVSQIYSPRASLYNSQGEILNDLEINDDVDADGEPDAMCADRDESKPSPTIQSTSKMLPPKTKKNRCGRGGGRKTATNPILKPPIFKRLTTRKCTQSSRSNKARGSAKETSSSAAAAADRMYTCSFKMYGCESTFSSKNEWKRHVVSQHLKLEFYRCDLKGCDDTHKGPNDFNRKDLFTQHLRRMHAPWPGKTVPSSAEKEKFENTLDAHAIRCVHKLRDPPARTNCVVCKEVFVAWSDRMEHMSKHYERLSQFKEARDPDLEAWACREDILSPKDSSSDELILTDLISKRRSG